MNIDLDVDYPFLTSSRDDSYTHLWLGHSKIWFLTKRYGDFPFSGKFAKAGILPICADWIFGSLLVRD